VAEEGKASLVAEEEMSRRLTIKQHPPSRTSARPSTTTEEKGMWNEDRTQFISCKSYAIIIITQVTIFIANNVSVGYSL
jgi:hypothetical protein